MLAIKELNNEKELLSVIAKGDEKAFTILFNHYRPPLYTLAIRLTGSGSVSEEIVQDVFLKIWVKRTTLPEVKNFPGYLVTVTQHTVYSALRTLSRQKQKLDLHDNSMSLFFHRDTEEQISEKEVNVVIEEAIQRLAPQQKQVYHLVKQNGLTREQAALEMHISSETVKAHLAQALRHIRAYCLLRLDPPVIIALTGLLKIFFQAD